MTLNVVSYNCRGINLESKGIINSLCQTNDIVLLQETWLTTPNLYKLKNINCNFDANGIPGDECLDDFTAGRPNKGLGFLWNKKLSNNIVYKKYDSDRIIGLEIKGACHKLLLLNVYLPYESTENFDEYLECLGVIDSLIQCADTNYVIICGDYNACFNKSFGRELIDFTQDNELIISDKCFLENDQTQPFTYVSEAHNSVSWLDHCVSTYNAHHKIQCMKILDEITFTDHIPLCFKYNIQLSKLNNMFDSVGDNNQRCDSVTDWVNASDAAKEQYYMKTGTVLNNINYPSVLVCSDMKCNSIIHRNEISEIYQEIVSKLLSTGYECIGEKKVKNYNIVPGWNDYVKDHHCVARDAYLLWRDSNKPRQGELFQNMLRTRAKFKYVLRECKNDEERLRADGLAKSLSDKDYVAFWKGVNQTNNSKVPLSADIDGVAGVSNITKLWKDHYASLFNSVKDNILKNEVENVLSNVDDDDDANNVTVLCSTNLTKDCISFLKSGKAPGSDGLYAEHLIFSNPRVHVLLSMIFNAMFVHGYVPSQLMNTVIVPLVKNKNGNCADKNNYRPVALSTAISKLLERIILHKIEIKLYTTSNQFAYKSNHSTDMCIFTLKQIIEYYTSRSTPVYVCYLDASKAFDSVNHWKLFKKLLDRKISKVFVRILVYWYSNQTYCVQWANCRSESFNVTNGVKQGGILSPKLFNVYMNDLSVMLTKAKIGCSIPKYFLNHLFYADDLVLITTSAKGMQKLLNMCSDYVNRNNIIFNPSKTVLMLYETTKTIKLYNRPSVYLNDTRISYSNTHKYLGVIMSNTNDNRDIKRQLRSYISKVNMLTQMFGKCSNDVKIHLYNSYCTSMYCIQLWANHQKSCLERFKVVYNNGFRKLFKLDKRCSASGMFATNYVLSFYELLRKNIYNFIVRINSSNNVFINYFSSSTVILQSPTWHYWYNCIYSFNVIL